MMQTEGLKILLVDDVQLVLQRLQILLSTIKSVSRTETSDSAEKTFALLDNFRPDIILLDINMPIMNGIDILKLIRERKDMYPVIIMLTNHAFSIYQDECMRLGANYFLDKSRDFIQIPFIIKVVQEQKARQYSAGA